MITARFFFVLFCFVLFVFSPLSIEIRFFSIEYKYFVFSYFFINTLSNVYSTELDNLVMNITKRMLHWMINSRYKTKWTHGTQDL